MTRTGLQWALCVSACMLAGTAFAQADADQTKPTSTATTRESGGSQQFCKSKDIVGATVKDSQGEKLGSVHELFLNPQNGQSFAAVDIGQSRNALVPLQALNVSQGRGGLFHKTEVTLNKTKADLESGPTIANNEWQKLDDAAFTQRIYSTYNMQPPAAAGGTGASTSTGTSAGSSTKSTQP